MRKVKKTIPQTEIIYAKKRKQYLDNRRKRFIELLGEECGYIESLVKATEISPWDINNLLEKGCPKEIAPRILL